MNVLYKPEPSDYWYYTRYCILTDPQTAIHWLIHLFGPGSLVFIALWFPLGPNPLADICITLIFSVLWITWRLSDARKTVLAAFERTPNERGDTTITIDSDGLWLHSDLQKTWIAWRGLIGIDQNDRHIYLFHERLQPWIVAKRDFAGETEAQKFYQTALEYWQARETQPMDFFPFDEEEAQGDGKRIEVVFKYTFEDYRRFALAYRGIERRKDAIAYYFGGIIEASIGTPFLWGAYHTAKSNDWNAIADLVVGLFFVWYGANTIWRASPWAFELGLAKKARDDRAAIGPRQETLTETSVTGWTPHRATRSGWPLIRHVEDNGESIILYVGTGLEAVPRAAFGSPEKAEAFLSMARDCAARANGDDPDGPGKSAWPPAPKV